MCDTEHTAFSGVPIVELDDCGQNEEAIRTLCEESKPT